MAGISPKYQLKVGDRVATFVLTKKLYSHTCPDGITKRRYWEVRCDCGLVSVKSNFKIKRAKFCSRKCTYYKQWLRESHIKYIKKYQFGQPLRIT